MIRIESLLRREIGLDAASIGSGLIQRTVRLRMKTHGHTTPEAYEHHLKNHPDELEELIESVVVTETWFYRDREPFHAFGQMALQVLSATPQAANCLRVLSVPCSTGEEPYSLAMTLLDAGASPDCYVIDAVDISARALARARTAVYGRNSFRGKDLAYRDRHFRPLLRSGAEGANPNNRDYALNPRVRDSVQFHRANLLGGDFLSGHAPYDFIFCRNLLIYFDRATQQRALEKLHRLLTAAGTLFVGPAEMPLVAGNAFTNANLPMTFACRKRPERAEVMQLGRIPDTRLQRPVKITPDRTTRTNRPASVTEKSPSTVPHRPTGSFANAKTPRGGMHDPVLKNARQLADAGRLEDAAAICETHLREQGPTAHAYYLLGLICDAQSNPKAAEYYRKALYLDPNHYETLLQMTLLLEKSGDPASRDAARKYQRRAARLQPKH